MDRRPLFDHAEIRSIAERCWLEIPRHHSGVDLDTWVIMPDHIHGIVWFTGAGVQLNVPTTLRNPADPYSTMSPTRDSLGAVIRTFKAAVTTLTECLWGQLRELGSNVSASILYPSTRTPGVMATGIWNAGANRPERYSRGGAEADAGGRDALKGYLARAKAAGEEVPIAPLSEVGELCVDAIKRNNFWATVSMERQDSKLRARLESQLKQTPPDYLLEPTLMAQSAVQRSKD